MSDELLNHSEDRPVPGGAPPEEQQIQTRKPRLGHGPRRGAALTRLPTTETGFTPEQRLLVLDAWRRSGLPAADFAPLVGVSRHTLYAWQKKFTAEGPAGLMDKPKGAPPGSRLPEVTRRTILMLKEAHPDWGCQRISDMLLRGPALPASPAAVARVLHEAGYTSDEVPTRPHEPKVTAFERAQPNQLWQTDLFTFILKRQNRRVYLVAFLDDHSRFLVGYGLHASQSTALVLEVWRAAIAGFGTPEEVLTDNGTQYVTWRGKGAFTKECEKRGVKQIVASPHRPQTLGKIERFWGRCGGSASRRRCSWTWATPASGSACSSITTTSSGRTRGSRVDAGGGVLRAAAEVKRTLEARVQANAYELARDGVPKAPFYLTGQAGGQPFSVHAEGERVILTRGDGRQEIDLLPPSATSPESVAGLPEPVCPQGVVSVEGEGFEDPPAPGESPLDDGLAGLRDAGVVGERPPEGGGQ